MAGRNEPCPCGSGIKRKRCCLRRADDVAAKIREHDAVFDDVVEWVQDQHSDVVVAAGEHTRLIRLMGGAAGRSMSAHWALADYRDASGAQPLLQRYALREDLDPRVRTIARELAAARLAVHRVVSCQPSLLILEVLDDGARLELRGERGLGTLAPGELVVARIAVTAAGPTALGMPRRRGPDCERRWRARLSTLPPDPSEASLAILQFIAEDAAEPLPDDLALHAVTLEIDDVEFALDDLGYDESFQDLGLALPAGYAYGWPVDDESTAVDLGGLASFELHEGARVIVTDERAVVASSCPTVLDQVVAHLRTLEAFALAAVPHAA